MIHTTCIVKAHGPRHETWEQAVADWRAGKDFRIVGTGTYMSIRDAHMFTILDSLMIVTKDGGSHVILAGRLI